MDSKSKCLVHLLFTLFLFEKLLVAYVGLQKKSFLARKM